MTLEKAFEEIIEVKVNERIAQLEANIYLLKPWFKVDTISEILDGKSDKWIIGKFCTEKNIARELVKKVGGEWHFRNPEFLNYVHDEWWEE